MLSKLKAAGALTVLVLAGVASAQNNVPAQSAPATASSAITSTRVHGTITDPDTELIPGATITLTPVGGKPVVVKSGGDGTYSVSVSPGKYNVLVTMPGFASFSSTNVSIPAVVSTTLDATLQIGVQNQVITVEANTVSLSVDPDANASATVLTGKDLDALSDDPDELSSELTALAGPSAGPNGGQIYVDGFTGGQLPPKSSIREIRINQNPFSAQYDKLGFGRIEVFTKPGTDKIHGSLQVNGDPSQFNSENPLEAGTYVPPYHTIFTFGSLTGPLSKKASYSIGGSYRAIQDDAFTNGSIFAAAAGDTTPCAPDADGCIVTPVMVSTNTPQSRFDITPRIDLALGEKNVLTTRFQFTSNSQTNQGVGVYALPEAAYNADSKNFELQMSDSQTINAHLINETRFEYERDHSSDKTLSMAPTVNVMGNFTSGGSGGQNSADHQDHIELQNYTSIQLKKNFIRFGGRLRTTREAEDSYANTNGLFDYSSLIMPVGCTSKPTQGTCIVDGATVADNSYQTGTPSQFTFTQLLVPTVRFTFADLGLYTETDWKARPNLTVSYGFRYETQNHLQDHHDFAPRVSVSYGVGSAKGTPKTVLRGGFGMFYDRFGQGNILTLQRENGINEIITTESAANVPASCSPSTFDPTNPGTCVTSGEGAVSQTVYSAGPGLRTPYTIQGAIGADQQIGRVGTLSLNYIHSQGVHQLATENVGYDAASDTSPDGVNYQYFTEGVFNQNQLTLNGRVQTSKRISLFGFYALNSVHGDTSGAGSFVTTPYHLAADYGRTTFDVRSRLFLGGSITLPKLIQFSPFLIGQSGNPFNVTTGFDNNGDTIFNDRPQIVAAGLANGGTVKTIPGCGTFAQPGTVPGAPTAPINACTGPALFTFNFRLTKTFGFGASTAKNAASGQGNGGGPGGGGPGGGGPGGGGGGRGGGPGFGGGGGASSGKRYNVALGLNVQNLFNNENLAPPNSALSSQNFGKSTQLNGGPYTTNSALRRISLQASFNF